MNRRSGILGLPGPTGAEGRFVIISKSEKSNVDKALIARGLRSLGLKQGDVAMVHASLSSFGRVEGGAGAVIDALLETVGETGTLLMPSHTDVRSSNRAGYDPGTTPVRKNIGLIPDTFWRRPDVLRGAHPPRHPWAAKGRLAAGLIRLSESSAIGAHHVAGILNALAALDGYIMMIGCGNDNNTSIHTAQVAAYNAVEGANAQRAEFLKVEERDKVDPPMLEAGTVRMGPIGDARIRLMESRGLFDAVRMLYETEYRGKLIEVQDYRDDPDYPSRAEREAMIEELKGQAAAALSR